MTQTTLAFSYAKALEPVLLELSKSQATYGRYCLRVFEKAAVAVCSFLRNMGHDKATLVDKADFTSMESTDLQSMAILYQIKHVPHLNNTAMSALEEIIIDHCKSLSAFNENQFTEYVVLIVGENRLSIALSIRLLVDTRQQQTHAKRRRGQHSIQKPKEEPTSTLWSVIIPFTCLLLVGLFFVVQYFTCREISNDTGPTASKEIPWMCHSMWYLPKMSFFETVQSPSPIK